MSSSVGLSLINVIWGILVTMSPFQFMPLEEVVGSACAMSDFILRVPFIGLFNIHEYVQFLCSFSMIFFLPTYMIICVLEILAEFQVFVYICCGCVLYEGHL